MWYGTHTHPSPLMYVNAPLPFAVPSRPGSEADDDAPALRRLRAGREHPVLHRPRHGPAQG